jgi:hypothetical protein
LLGCRCRTLRTGASADCGGSGSPSVRSRCRALRTGASADRDRSGLCRTLSTGASAGRGGSSRCRTLRTGASAGRSRSGQCLSTAKRCMAVDKILPPLWGLPGAAWRLAPSHQLIGALDPPAVTSVSALNTRSLVFCRPRGGPGGAPRSGPGLPGRGWGPSGFGFESVPGGFLAGSNTRARGRPKECGHGGQKVASKAWRDQLAEGGADEAATSGTSSPTA